MFECFCYPFCCCMIIIFLAQPVPLWWGEIVIWGISQVTNLGEIAPMRMPVQMLGNARKDPLVVATSCFQLQDILHSLWIDKHHALFAAFAIVHNYSGLIAILGIVLQNVSYFKHLDLIAPQPRCIQKAQEIRPV